MRAPGRGLKHRLSLRLMHMNVTSKKKDPKGRGVEFIPTKGSLIGGVSKERTERITDAMTDLQLGIGGLESQLSGVSDGAQWVCMLESFARICSVFLRKTVLGDYDKRETRLLNDRVLGSTGLRFNRLRKIPQNIRRGIEIDLGLSGAMLQMTKLNDHTPEPEETYHAHAGSQGLKLSIEWPLPGAADWIGAPSDESL